MDEIKEIIESFSLPILIYAIMITSSLILIVFRKKSIQNKLIDWKKDTLKLPFYSREWERNDDQLLIELFAENERLETELKLRKKEYNKISLFVLIIILLIVVKEKISDLNPWQAKQS